jgi:hypothetical protein
MDTPVSTPPPARQWSASTSSSLTARPVSRSDAARASAEQHATPSPSASVRFLAVFAFFAFATRVFAALSAAA